MFEISSNILQAVSQFYLPLVVIIKDCLQERSSCQASLSYGSLVSSQLLCHTECLLQRQSHARIKYCQELLLATRAN